MASFQLSPVNTALMRWLKSAVAGREGEIVREMSYRAKVKQKVSLRNSLRNTAVEVKYLRPPTSGNMRE